MIDTDTFDPLAFVLAAAPATGITLSAERAAEVAEAFALVVRMGAPALQFALADNTTEPAPVFAP
jgi:hypothetical protein